MISHRICWASTCATVSISLGLALESFGQKLPKLQQAHFITSHFFTKCLYKIDIHIISYYISIIFYTFRGNQFHPITSNSIQFPVGLRCAWGATAAHSDTRRCWPAASLLGLTMPILVAHNLTEDRFDKEHVAYVCVCNYMCVIVCDCRWLYMYMHVCMIICVRLCKYVWSRCFKSDLESKQNSTKYPRMLGTLTDHQGPFCQLQRSPFLNCNT